MIRRHKRVALGIVAAGLLALSACGGDSASEGSSGGDSGSSGAESTTLSLVGFAVPKAGNDAAQAEFAKTPEGEGVKWKASYGASGEQSRAVAAGLEADYVHFSISPDVTRLEEAGLVAPSWDDGDNKGIATDSVVVFVVRKGNPKGIKTWDDLVKPDVSIVTPNPGSSGAARWNILAAYGSVLTGGGSDADAQAYLDELLGHVAALPGSGRDATTAFLGGTGDVLLSYENEAILARQNGEDFDYVVPESTLLIENPGAVLKDADPKAKAYLDFVLSDEGQKAFVSKGFRPISGDLDSVGTIEGANDPSNPFPAPEHLQTIDEDFGGWSAVNDKFFDEDNGIVTKALAESGKS